MSATTFWDLFVFYLTVCAAMVAALAVIGAAIWCVVYLANLIEDKIRAAAIKGRRR